MAVVLSCLLLHKSKANIIEIQRKSRANRAAEALLAGKIANCTKLWQFKSLSCSCKRTNTEYSRNKKYKHDELTLNSAKLVRIAGSKEQCGGSGSGCSGSEVAAESDKGTSSLQSSLLYYLLTCLLHLRTCFSKSTNTKVIPIHATSTSQHLTQFTPDEDQS